MPSICLITPGHLASTPRLVREADALTEAGYNVHVIYGRHFPPAEKLDKALLSKAQWKAYGVPLTNTLRASLATAKNRIIRHTRARTWQRAAEICQAHVYALASSAHATNADAYYGHCLGGLGAAALVASKNHKPIGFDIEDFHEAETEVYLNNPLMHHAARLLQSQILPKCRLLTSSSEAIADKYGEKYGVKSTVLHNVYPLRESGKASTLPSHPSPARLYWFSQTIGPGRGLEEAIATLGNMQIPAELSLRGFISPAYRRELESLAQHYRLAHPLVFLPPGNPDDMPRLSKGYHLGLSLERRTPDNRNICLTNKIFAYLLAGIPVWLSETDAQRRLAGVLGEAALVAEPSDSQETARKLDAWLGNPEALRTSAEKAMELGRIKFNWDIEQRIFLKLVHSQLFFRNASPP